MVATFASIALSTALAGFAPKSRVAPAVSPRVAARTTDGTGKVSSGSIKMTPYTVQAGDTIWKISQVIGVSETSVIQENNLRNPSSLTIGQVLQIPQDHSITALQRKLADLGYLPLTDSLAWAYSNVPPSLKELWKPGVDNVMTWSAVMELQGENGLVVDGLAGPTTWAILDKDLVGKMQNPNGYSYVYVSDTTPFTLYLWNDGKYVLSSLTNLGLPKAETVTGTYPVYKQYASQEMTGTNPDGTTYDDADVPYVSYFYQGEAIHGYPRASYGSAQSLGCVELPYAQAQTAWKYIDIGTMVTINK